MKLQLFSSIELPIASVIWSEDDIEIIRYNILIKSLKTLKDKRSCLKEKTDVLEWLLSDEAHPFSFILCCHSQMIDYREFRQRIIGLIKQL